MPSKSRHVKENRSDGHELPAFDSDALSSLTQKIQNNLRKDGPEKVSKPSPATLNGKKVKKKKNKKKEDENREPPMGSARVGAKTEKKIGKSQSGQKQNSSLIPEFSQGKKRSRDGRVKEPREQKSGENVNGIKLGVRAPKPASGGDLNVDEDVQALGGTQEDIDLVRNVPSDSEIEGEDESNGSIATELQRFIRQLGVDTVGKQQLANDNPASDSDDEAPTLSQNAVVNGRANSDQPNGPDMNVLLTKTVGKGGKGTIPLSFEPQSEWHAVELPALPKFPYEATALPKSLTDRLHEHAKSLLERENKQYSAHKPSASSAHQFYSTIMSTGTLSDKISALTLSVQESPVHNMKALESLVGLARKRSRGQAVEVLGALKDLFGLGNLLPSNRKLRTFAGQPAIPAVFEPTNFQWTPKDPLPKHLQASHLIVWAYEDWLKAIYFEVLKIIETWCNDEVVFARGKAVDYLCQLLKEKPEQEANLLRLLVNKLGDSDKKIASKTSFHILQLETTHPLMKPTIITAIESDLLFRPGQSLHAKYYATITLNQTVLSGTEEGVARKLLDIYFSLFVKLLEKPESGKPTDVDPNKVIINRNGEVQGGGAAGGKKALKKQAEKEKSTAADEELCEKMISAVLTGVNRAIPFISTNDESFERHIGTLFKVTHSSNFNTSIQALMLIQQLTGTHQGLVDRFYRTLYESLLDPRLLTSSKQALYLNLLFRALRSDLNLKRVKAFAKRLLQVVALHQPSFTCGTIYLLRELESVFANLQAFIDQAPEDDDDEEHFKDVDQGHSNVPFTPNHEAPLVNAVSTRGTQESRQYDGRKRDPEHSNADYSCLWELTPFLQHYHPSVSLFASRLLTHHPMPPKPDLSLNTLIHFLDRFVYRNPKTTNASRGASIMQPMASGDSSALLVSAYSNKGRNRQPVNSEAFWKQDTGKVGADEVFFHRYFNALGKGREKAKKKKADKKRKDGEDSESEGDEDEIWKALVDSRPELDEDSDGGIFSEDDLGSEMDVLGDADDGPEDGEGEDLDDAQLSDSSFDLDDDDDEALLDSDEDAPIKEGDFDPESQLSKSKKTTTSGAPEEGEKRSVKRRRLKNLPTFASADDYAKMLDDD